MRRSKSQISNLSALSKSVVMQLSIQVAIAILVVSVLGSAYMSSSLNNRQQVETRQIDSALETYKNNIATQLSIIASSDNFVLFINSGAASRQDLWPRFMAPLLKLKPVGIVGFTVNNKERDDPFSSGKVTSDYLRLGLCYMDGRLNSFSLGTCINEITLYFSKPLLYKQINLINNKIHACEDIKGCKKLQLVTEKTFGSFAVQSSDIGLKLKVGEGIDPVPIYLILSIIAILIIGTTNVFYIKRKLSKTLAKPINELLLDIHHGKVPQTPSLEELKYLVDEIERWKAEAVDKALSVESERNKEAIALLVKKVCHDIRSPASALRNVIDKMMFLPEHDRVQLRTIANRILDIANELFVRHKPNHEGMISKILIYPIIESIVSESRLVSKSNVDIEAIVSLEGYFAIAAFDDVKLKRALSNLINNALESLNNSKGEILIKLGVEAGIIHITITDNGCGISEDLLPIIEKGVSLRKPSGSGFGLKHTKTYLESINGELHISSKAGVGTVVTITIPSVLDVDLPAWYISEINIAKNSHIIVIDDDDAVHNEWSLRFLDLGLSLHHYCNPHEALSWLEQNIDSNVIIFCDYEFISLDEPKITGIDLLNQINSPFTRILVTNNFDLEGLGEECSNKGIKLLPKPLVKHIQIISEDDHVQQPAAIIITSDYAESEEVLQQLVICYSSDVLVISTKNDLNSLYCLLSTDTPVYVGKALIGIDNSELIVILKTLRFTDIRVIY